MTSRPGQILLVTERPLLLLSFRQLLQAAGFGVEDAVLNAGELVRSISSRDAALIVVDLESGLTWETLTQMHREFPNLKFVIWCSQVTPLLAQQALEAGMHGLLSSRLPLGEASQSLFRICEGQRQFRFESEAGGRAQAESELSPREEQVVALVRGGHTNRQVAVALGTTEGSVKVYLKRVFGKTGIKSRRELALPDTASCGVAMPVVTAKEPIINLKEKPNHMIRLNVNEQQLFDMIMAVYSAASSEGTQADAEAVQRREALLDKLHRAFDTKIMTPRAENASRLMGAGSESTRNASRRARRGTA